MDDLPMGVISSERIGGLPETNVWGYLAAVCGENVTVNRARQWPGQDPTVTVGLGVLYRGYIKVTVVGGVMVGAIFYGGGAALFDVKFAAAAEGEHAGVTVLRRMVAASLHVDENWPFLQRAGWVAEMSGTGSANKRLAKVVLGDAGTYVVTLRRMNWEEEPGTKAMRVVFTVNEYGVPINGLCEVSFAESSLGPTDRGDIQDPKWESVQVDMSICGLPPALVAEYHYAANWVKSEFARHAK